MLANHEIKKNLEKTTRKNSEIKFLPQYLSTNMDITFYKDTAFIFFTTENPIGFLLKNKEATKGFKSYFETLWNIAKS